MTPHALLFTLTTIGISETAYLIRKRLAKERPVCVIGQECHLVLESKYNNILGIPNEVAGFVFYVAISLMTAFLIIGTEPVALWVASAKILIGIGVVMSIVFTYLQWQVIKAWCFWCLMSAVTVFLMAFIITTSDLTVIV